MVGRKITVLRQQPLACFEIDEIDDAGWRSVIVEGRYEEVTDERAGRAALRLLGVGDEGFVSRSLTATGHFVVFRLRPTEKSGRFERYAD
jgi:nitroimidazol reductase NimA-like FMN-containing flavoprotein (pyridoxamine 5'-phosphate oxidase superfamily)